MGSFLHGRRHTGLSLAIAGIAGLLLTACESPPPPADLAVQVDPACSTCEVFIRCDAGFANAAVYDPAFDLYRLEPAGVINRFSGFGRTEVRRPLVVYRQRPGDAQVFARTSQPDQTAVVDLKSFRITLPDAAIDQKTGNLLGLDGNPRGSCRTLPEQEALQLVSLFDGEG